MKMLLHFPVEQYGFIEVEEDIGSIEEAFDVYHISAKFYKSGEGISVKDFNDALDTYLVKETGNTEQYLSMSKQQQDVFQEIKKALARIKSREGKPVIS